MNKQPIIYFRADGNTSIGTGHIMRCLSLAKAFRELFFECVFLCADSSMQNIITSQNFSCHILNSQWDNLSTELNIMHTFFTHKPKSFLIIDTYFVTPSYLSAFPSYTDVIYIDDLHSFDYPVSTLINYNIFSDSITYPSHMKTYLGLKFAPLRAEFINLPYHMINNVKNLLILTGGADPENCAIQLFTHFYESTYFPNLEFHFVLGSLYPKYEELYHKTNKLSNIHLHQNITNISTLMQKCDLAISASGSTLYELCACGTPTITYTLADNQLEIANAFSNKNLMPYIGDFRKNTKVLFDHLDNHIHDFINHPHKLSDISTKLQKLVDGNGAKRLAKEMITLLL